MMYDSEYVNFFSGILLLATMLACVYNGFLNTLGGHTAVNFCFATTVAILAFTFGVEDNPFFGPLGLPQCQAFAITLHTAVFAGML